MKTTYNTFMIKGVIMGLPGPSRPAIFEPEEWPIKIDHPDVEPVEEPIEAPVEEPVEAPEETPVEPEKTPEKVPEKQPAEPVPA